MHILDLPSEIFQKILYHLDSRHLYESAFVCKSWNVPALERWYNYNLRLDNNAYETVLGLLEQDSEQRDKYFQYAHLVRKLDFRIPMPQTENLNTFWRLYVEEFVHCLEYFPNLVVLNIQNDHFADRCYKRIASSPPIRALKNIQEIGSAKYPVLEIIPDRDHFKACYLYHTTITKINTSYIKDVLDGRDTFDLLKDFTQLSELYLIINDLKSWLNEIGVDNVVRFVERLSKMNRFRLSWPFFYERSEALHNRSGSRLKISFKFVKAFKTDNTFIRTTFVIYSKFHWTYTLNSFLRNRADLFSNRIEYNSKTGYHFQYELESFGLNYFKTKNGNVHVKQDVALSTDTDGLEKLNFVKFIFINNNFNPDGFFEILQLALINCPNLKFYQHSSLRVESDVSNHILIGADLAHFGTEQQVEYYHQRSTETKKNLRSVKFHNILPSQELLDLLTSHLPNIETIAILRTDDNDVFHLNKSVVDLTCLEKLNSVYFEVKKLADYPEHYFVRLQYTDDDESYYYYQSSKRYKSLLLKDSEFVNKCLNSIIFTRIVTVKCEKDIKITICAPDVGVIAEIVNCCQLSYISDDSHKNYKLLSDGFEQLK